MTIWNLESENQLLPCRRNLFAFISLLIIILSIYSNTFDASFHFDDWANIQTNKALFLEKLSWANVTKTFFANPMEEGKFYRPVACFSLALNYYFGRTDVFGYHLVNILIHIATAIFLFLFIYYTLNLPLLSSRYGSKSYFIAFLATVLWAINPVHTQAITYIVQRMASLAAMFYIVAMYCYLKGRTSKKTKTKLFFYFLCIISGILSVGSKENAVMLPISIFLFDLLVVQGVTKDNLKRSAYVFCVLVFVPLSFAVILKGAQLFDFRNLSTMFESSRPFTMLERVLTEPRIILFYVSQLLYPMPGRLNICHDISVSKSLIDPATTLIAILIILLLLGVCIKMSTKMPLISFCVIFFFLNHLIEGSIFPLELIFEHRNYLPSFFLFLPLAILLVKGIEHYKERQFMRGAIIVFTVLVIVGYSHSTFIRNFAWKNDETLWTDAISKAPELSRPYHNLGNYYFTKLNLVNKALPMFMEAKSKKIAFNKLEPYELYYNIGTAYILLEKFEKAIKYLKLTTSNYPSFAPAHNNLGFLFLQKGLLDQAEHEFNQALIYSKGNVQAYKNLSNVMSKKDETEKAVKYLEKALELNPKDINALASLGYFSLTTGKNRKSVYFFEEALRVRPDNFAAHLFLAEACLNLGMEAKAETHIETFSKKGKGNQLAFYIKGMSNEDHQAKNKRLFRQEVLMRLAKRYKNTATGLNRLAQKLENGRYPKDL